jgi:hypothetical protein
MNDVTFRDPEVVRVLERSFVVLADCLFSAPCP